MATQETIARPAPFVEKLGEDLATQVTAQTAVPIVSTGLQGLGTMAQPTKQSFESDDDFKRRQDLFKAQQQAALGFEARKQGLAGLAPKVEGLSTLEQAAKSRAVSGLGSFQPFLDQAQAASAAAFNPQVAQQFMSPYQQQVIDTTLEEFDRQRAMQEQRISDQAVASGAFGGGRQGVLESEFRTGSDRDRALLNAQLLQQGFGQAQALAAQRFGQQTGLASMLPQLQRADVSTLGQLGALDRGLAQAQRDADREAARMAAFQPQEQVDRYANLVTGIMGGYPGQTQTTNIPNPTPLQNALAIASTGAGIYKALGEGARGFAGLPA